ncbi:murein transglycosylase domain-containing protein [Candidatus Ferrigenium straubiae]|uniref:murein transglycosylase domain-containing protein n=1 Tax=Candidatus Ferrigenium straubiae TaxID=2919506 RepID=UPI003F4A9E78
MRNFILALTTVLLLASCKSVSTGSVITVATSSSPQAAARALLQRKKLAYIRNPVQIANDLKGVQRDFKRLMDILSGNAGKKWGQKEARLPDRTHYVKYTQGYLSRAIVDFDRGEITVETLDEKNPANSLKDAIVTTLLTPDDPRAVDLFSDSSIKLTGERDPYLLGLVLDDNGRAIATPQQADRFAGSLVKDAQSRSVKTDAGSKQARFVKFAMVSNFANKQAEKYRPLVEKYAKTYDVSPSLVFAIMRTESNFNPFAVSSAPAYGLMQLVPSSGGRDAYKRAKGANEMPSKQYLFNAENNIELGVAYLNVLAFDELDEVADPVSREYCVISAYNTGPGNVLRAFGGSSKNRDGALDEINRMAAPAVYDRLRAKLPYAETRQYLQKVVGFRKQFIALN